MINRDGKNNLNLTDRDMQLLSETAIAIRNKRRKQNHVENIKKVSYYEESANLKLYPKSIFVYDFETAKDLACMLKSMWEYQEKKEMYEIVANCVASTYKYLDYKPSEREKKEISPFIYEF